MKTETGKGNVTRKETRSSSYPNLSSGIERVDKGVRYYNSDKYCDCSKMGKKYGV